MARRPSPPRSRQQRVRIVGFVLLGAGVGIAAGAALGSAPLGAALGAGVAGAVANATPRRP